MRLDVVPHVPCNAFDDVVVSLRGSVVGKVESPFWDVVAGAVDNPEHVMTYPL